jgi:DNA-binding Lrp family transcriptional regulator
MSLKAKILNYLESEYPRWVHGGEIEDLARSWQFKSSNASRRARELVNEGKIIRAENLKRQVVYQAIKKGRQESDLNIQLKQALKSIPVNWDNQYKIKEINEAIKSKNDFCKQQVLKRYKP